MKAFLAGALVLAFPCAAMAQIAVLQIKIVDGEGAVHALGAHISHPLTVEVTDDNGRPVAGAAVSFQLPPEGASGLFSNGLRTDLVLTDNSGRASIHSVQLNRTGGQFRIRITAVKEQARAGAVALQYIGENHPETARHGTGHPDTSQPESHPSDAAITPTAVPAKTAAAAPRATVKSGEITPTTVKMSSGGHKKWIILAVIVAAGAGAAFVGVSKAKAGSSNTVSSGVVSIGTPTITIGNP